MNKKTIAIVAVVAVVIVGFLVVRFFSAEPETETEERVGPPAGTPGPADVIDTTLVDLFEVDESGQSGFATIDEFDDETQVVLQISGEPDSTRSASIRSGSCDNPGEVMFDLNDVVNGRSETSFGISADEIVGAGPFLIAVFATDDESEALVACGDR